MGTLSALKRMAFASFLTVSVMCCADRAHAQSTEAIAVSGGYSFLTDDVKTRRMAQAVGVTVSGSVGVLLELIRTRKLTLEEGSNVLMTFIRHGYFSPVDRLDEFFQ